METSFFSCKSNRTLVTLILVALLASLSSYAYHTLKQAQYVHSGPSSFSVSGEGEVVAKPDIGQFSFSVIAEGEDANTVQKDSGTKVEEIIAFLVDEGVEEKDIKTTSYSLHPKYRYENNDSCEPGIPCPVKRTPDGFEVNQTISVKVREVDNSGTLIAGAGKNGATNISRLQFTIDDTDALREEARSQAIAEAKSKAEALADELGVKITKMVAYNEGMPRPVYGYGGDSVEMAQSKSSYDEAIVPTGENKITSNVTITYQFR